MRKNLTTLFTAALLVTSAGVFAQTAGVGIDTTTPNSTLDVNGKLGATDLDGLQAPRLTRAQLSAKGDALYGANQKGALIYITDISAGNNTGPRVNIDAIGYYYFDGTVWQKLISSYNNIYNANGTLTGTRVLTQDDKTLTIANDLSASPGGGQKTVFSNKLGYGMIQDSGSGTRATISLQNGGNPSLHIFTDTNSQAQMNATGNSTGLSIGTGFTAAPSGIQFVTTPAASTNGATQFSIEPNGNSFFVQNLGIGYSTTTFAPGEKLKVSGSITTATTTYPDYVFEEYYNGKSLLNSKYKFLNIYDTEKFIKENNHLPGVTSINDLAKTENGLYSFNLSELSTQTLEKVEELYLHVIKQQTQIDAQKEQINKLLHLTQKLQKKIKSKKH